MSFGSCPTGRKLTHSDTSLPDLKMPYERSLQTYTKPEFYEPAPEAWERRLREISPITDQLSHLSFRKFSPRADWKESPFNTQPNRPIWAVYSCTPKHLVGAERAEQFRLHWSELPIERQAGRKSVVTNYQHFMWHSQGVEARPLWFLQGDWGGTPTMYSAKEKRWLDASGVMSEPFPCGWFAGCPLDELAVKGLLLRDRLIEALGDFDRLKKMDRPDALRAADDEAEQVFRETYLETLAVMAQPAIEYMKSAKAKTEISVLPPAPEGLEHTLATWKDVWMETGNMIGVTSAPHKKVFATV